MNGNTVMHAWGELCLKLLLCAPSNKHCSSPLTSRLSPVPGGLYVCCFHTVCCFGFSSALTCFGSDGVLAGTAFVGNLTAFDVAKKCDAK